MKVSATIRNTETGDLGEIQADEPTYDAGYAALVKLTPQGWKMNAVSVERDANGKPV